MFYRIEFNLVSKTHFARARVTLSKHVGANESYMKPTHVVSYMRLCTAMIPELLQEPSEIHVL